MSKKTMDKRGQLTLFIILAIVIVAAILVFFFYIQPTFLTSTSSKIKVEACIEDVVKQSIDDLGKTGGFANPQLSYMYQGEKIGYICYTNLYYKTCIVQTPFLINNFENELMKVTKEKINACFDSALKSLENEGYSVSGAGRNITISLNPGRVDVELDAPVYLTKDALGQKFTRFYAQVNSPIYDLLMISTSIMQYEARFGDSDTTTLMFYYPDIIIDKLKQSDGTKIYIVQNKNTKTKFQFATRSLAWPAGYGVDTGLVREQ